MCEEVRRFDDLSSTCKVRPMVSKKYRRRPLTLGTPSRRPLLNEGSSITAARSKKSGESNFFGPIKGNAVRNKRNADR